MKYTSKTTDSHGKSKYLYGTGTSYDTATRRAGACRFFCKRCLYHALYPSQIKRHIQGELHKARYPNGSYPAEFWLGGELFSIEEVLKKIASES